MRGYFSFLLLTGIAVSLAFQTTPVFAGSQPSNEDLYKKWTSEMQSDIAQIEKVSHDNDEWNKKHGDTIRIVDKSLAVLTSPRIAFPKLEDTAAHIANQPKRMERMALMKDAIQNLKQLETDPAHPIESLKAFKQDFEALLKHVDGFTEEEKETKNEVRRVLKVISSLDDHNKGKDLPTRGSKLRPVKSAAELQSMHDLFGSVKSEQRAEANAKTCAQIHQELDKKKNDRVFTKAELDSTKDSLSKLESGLPSALLALESAHSARVWELQSSFNNLDYKSEVQQSFSHKQAEESKLHTAISEQRNKIASLERDFGKQNTEIPMWSKCLADRESVDSKIHASKVSVKGGNLSEQKSTHDGITSKLNEISQQIGAR